VPSQTTCPRAHHALLPRAVVVSPPDWHSVTHGELELERIHLRHEVDFYNPQFFLSLPLIR